MVIRAAQFNLYLLVIVALACGCQSNKGPTAAMRLYLEANRDGTSLSQQVAVYRAHPVLIIVESAPFITESDITTARVLDIPGGFVMQLKLDQHGLLVLNQNAASNPGRHYAVECRYGEKQKLIRWLAAPLLPRQISMGTISFTPDADREEAEFFVRGLTNTIAKVRGEAFIPEQ